MGRERSNEELDRDGLDSNASKRGMHEVRYYLGRRQKGNEKRLRVAVARKHAQHR